MTVETLGMNFAPADHLLLLGAWVFVLSLVGLALVLRQNCRVRLSDLFRGAAGRFFADRVAVARCERPPVWLHPHRRRRRLGR